MGLIGSKVYRNVLKYSRRFNVENRAHRQLDRDKVTARPAPKHNSFQQELKKAEELGFGSQIHLKNEKLDKYLQHVFVNSKDDNFEFKSDKNRKPASRKRFESIDPMVTHKEPEVISDGKCSLKQVMKFLTDHQASPYLINAEHISKEYKISKTVTDNILKYYSVCEIYEPNKKVAVTMIQPAKSKKATKEDLLNKITKKDKITGN